MTDDDPVQVLDPVATAAQVVEQLEQRGLMPAGDTRPEARRGTVQAPPQSAGAPTLVEMSEDVGELFAALAAAQGEFHDVERTLTAKIKSKREGGADFSYDYAPLDEVLRAVRPILSKHGIAVLQFPQARQHSVLVRTLLAHRSGQRMWNDLSVGCVSTDPKDIGSAITYARRYSLMALLGIAPDTDDDGAAAAGQRGAVAEKRPKPEPAKPPGDVPVKLTSVRPISRGKKTVWGVKHTDGECWTEDAGLAEAATAALRAERPVVLRCERRADAGGRAYSVLVEVVAPEPGR